MIRDEQSSVHSATDVATGVVGRCRSNDLMDAVVRSMSADPSSLGKMRGYALPMRQRRASSDPPCGVPGNSAGLPLFARYLVLVWPVTSRAIRAEIPPPGRAKRSCSCVAKTSHAVHRRRGVIRPGGLHIALTGGSGSARGSQNLKVNTTLLRCNRSM